MHRGEISPVPSLWIERDGGCWDAPINPTPSGLSGFMKGLKDGAPLEIYGGTMTNRRFVSEALDSSNSTLRITARYAARTGSLVVSYDSVDSAPIEWLRLDSATLEATINSISGIAAAGGVSVSGAFGRYTVTGREKTALSDITVTGLGVAPTVFSRTSTSVNGNASLREVQIIEIEPAAIQVIDSDDWSSIAAPTLSATVTDGGASNYEVTNIKFDRPPAGGSWTATPANTTRTISVFASAQDVQDALNGAIGGSPFRVAKIGPWEWEAFNTSTGNQTDVTVEDASVLAHVGLTDNLDYSSLLTFAAGDQGDFLPARVDLHLVWSDGNVVDLAADIMIPLDAAPSAATAVTTTGNNIIGTYPATEAISAARFVNIYDNSGTDSIRAAQASTSLDADGWIEDSAASGSSVTVYGTTGTLTGLSGLTTGNPLWLGEAGAPTETEPVAGISQDLGEAASDGSMSVNIQAPVVL